ncbi:MAG: DUF721 domain-containing protein [Magnetococcales bacterium]|nr:DUF721 domain-containing protein [Magnetococcales bacterium]
MTTSSGRPGRSPARRRKRRQASDPEELGSLIRSLADRALRHPHARASRIWQRWPEVVGEQMAKHTEPYRLIGGVLTVRADSPVWVTELNHLKGALMEKLKQASFQEVTDIRFRTGVLRYTWRSGRHRLRRPKPLPIATRTEIDWAEKTVDQVEDEALRRAIYRVVLKGKVRLRREDAEKKGEGG